MNNHRNIFPPNGGLYHYAGNNPVKYVDPTGTDISDWQDNGDGTWTVIHEVAKLWDVWGKDAYSVTGLTEEEAKHIHVGDTFGKKTVQESNQQSIQSESQINKSDQGDFFTWIEKEQGAPLTPNEVTIQKIWGSCEMIAGPVVMVGACEATSGASVLTGSYIMADGAVMIGMAEQGTKQAPLLFFLNLLNPCVGEINDTPVITEIPDPTRFILRWRMYR